MYITDKSVFPDGDIILFELHELIALANRASTVRERISDKYVPVETQISTEYANKRLDIWCRYAAAGDRNLFHAQFEKQGLNFDLIVPLLGEVRQPPGSSVPAWIATFEWAAMALSAATDVGKLAGVGHPIPFEDFLLPLVHAARNVRDTGRNYVIGLTTEAVASLDCALLNGLSELLTPTLLEEFFVFKMFQSSFLETGIKRGGSEHNTNYNSFIVALRTARIREIFLARPVLGRLISTLVDQWIDGTLELLERLSLDIPVVSESLNGGLHPGTVVSIEYGLSDPHNGGRMVSIIKFSSGLQILYKPKNQEIDGAWAALVKWLDEHGAPASTRAPKVIARNNYGWSERIEAIPCASRIDAQEFFRKAGALLCLVYLLQGTDIHFENVIASGTDPCLVDFETLLHPWLADSLKSKSSDSAQDVAWRMLRASVLATGYLPNWIVIPGGRIAGMGGLNADEIKEVSRWAVQYVNSDTMRLVKEQQLLKPRSNLPLVDGNALTCREFKKELIDGFSSMYEFVTQHREKLHEQIAPFGGLVIRAVLRPTELYAAIMRRSCEPRNLSDGADWSLHFEFLSRFVNHGYSDQIGLVESFERDSLALMDVPFFKASTRSADLFIHKDVKLTGFFASAPFDQVSHRLDNFQESDRLTQVAIISHTLDSIGDRAVQLAATVWPFKEDSSDGDGSPNDQTLEFARSIAGVISHAAILAGDGAAWIGAVQLPGDDRCQLEVIGFDLYSGSTGVAVFLAALSKVTGSQKYRTLAFAALSPLRNELLDWEGRSRLSRTMGIGGGSGLGSVVYALSLCSCLLDDQDIISDAVRAAMLIDEKAIAADSLFDVVAGSAGAILGLLSLYSLCGDPKILESARVCGEHLVQSGITIDNECLVWKTIGEIPLTGFSHGAAGIALALMRLYRANGETKYWNAANNAMEYERSVFSSNKGNWPDFRPPFSFGKTPGFPSIWAHGAPGVGLARLGVLEIDENARIRDEIDLALIKTIESPMNGLDALSFGNFGCLDFLFTAGMGLKRGDLRSLARDRASTLIARHQVNQNFVWPAGKDAQNPSLFAGISGIGYQLLRMEYPQILPAVLLWNLQIGK